MQIGFYAVAGIGIIFEPSEVSAQSRAAHVGMAKPCLDASGFSGCIVNDLHQETFIYKLSVAFCKSDLANRYTVNNTGFPVDRRYRGGKDGWG